MTLPYYISEPQEKPEIPMRHCPLCGEQMPYARCGWFCEGVDQQGEPCGGSIDDCTYEPSYDEICKEDR